MGIGDTVFFVYNGKDRIGQVEKITDELVTLEFEDGSYKSFRFDRMETKPEIMAKAD